MHRTQIYLPEGNYHELQMLGREQRRSLAELIRLAVERYLEESRRSSRLEQLEKGFGLWANRDPDVSTEDMVRELRSEWTKRGGLEDAPHFPMTDIEIEVP